MAKRKTTDTTTTTTTERAIDAIDALSGALPPDQPANATAPDQPANATAPDTDAPTDYTTDATYIVASLVGARRHGTTSPAVRVRVAGRCPMPAWCHDGIGQCNPSAKALGFATYYAGGRLSVSAAYSPRNDAHNAADASLLATALVDAGAADAADAYSYACKVWSYLADAYRTAAIGSDRNGFATFGATVAPKGEASPMARAVVALSIGGTADGWAAGVAKRADTRAGAKASVAMATASEGGEGAALALASADKADKRATKLAANAAEARAWVRAMLGK